MRKFLRLISTAKSEIDRADDERVRDDVVPFDRLAKDDEREEREDNQRDALLHNLQLREREATVARDWPGLGRYTRKARWPN